MSKYTSQSDVEPLIKFIDDDTSTDLYNTALENADAWVDAMLLSNSLSIWTTEISTVTVEVNGQNQTREVETIQPEDKPIPNLVKTAAKYYTASDIILALYNGEELPTQYDVYFQKAQEMINLYISEQKDLLATTELLNKNIVKHSKGLTYYQKRRMRR